jgi:hypothetical protein
MRPALEKMEQGTEIMSAVGIDAAIDLAAARGGPAEISRRLESRR